MKTRLLAVSFVAFAAWAQAAGKPSAIHWESAKVKRAPGIVAVLQGAATPIRKPGDYELFLLSDSGERVLAQLRPGSELQAETLYIGDIAVERSRVVVAASAGPGPGSGVRGASFLLFYDAPFAEASRIVRISPISCSRLTLAEDGSVWCLGPGASDLGASVAAAGDATNGRGFLHHFRPDGILVGSHLGELRADESLDRKPWYISELSQSWISVRGTTVDVWIPRWQRLISYDSRTGAVAQEPVAVPADSRVFDVARAGGITVALTATNPAEADWSMRLLTRSASDGSWHPLGGARFSWGSRIAGVEGDGAIRVHVVDGSGAFQAVALDVPASSLIRTRAK